MPRVAMPLVAADLSSFARALGRALKDRHSTHPEPPGHVELMNLLARAAGHRNLQSLQSAARLPRLALAPEDVPAPPALSGTVRKALQQFDSRGRLVRWPAKLSVQRLAMAALWTRFDTRRRYSEREVNELLKAAHAFGDHATLRRELVNHHLLARESDCSTYWKLPVRADEEMRWFLHAWRRLQRTPASPASRDPGLGRNVVVAAVPQRVERGAPAP